MIILKSGNNHNNKNSLYLLNIMILQNYKSTSVLESIMWWIWISKFFHVLLIHIAPLNYFSNAFSRNEAKWLKLFRSNGVFQNLLRFMRIKCCCHERIKKHYRHSRVRKVISVENSVSFKFHEHFVLIHLISINDLFQFKVLIKIHVSFLFIVHTTD